MRIEYAGGMKLVASHRGHTVVTDQTAKEGGDDTALTPTELFIASLGTCPLVYVLAFAKRHDIPVEGLTADVDYEIVDNPRRVGRFSIAIRFPQPVDDQHRAALQRAAEQCLVHNSLLQPPAVTVLVE
jgi:uncharacterized OsmC-like protein